MISASKILQLIPSLSLALHILSEKFMPNSFWRPYLDILPKSFDIPLFWSIEDLSLLKGSPIQCKNKINNYDISIKIQEILFSSVHNFK